MTRKRSGQAGWKIDKLKELHGNRCMYCGLEFDRVVSDEDGSEHVVYEPFVVDHFTPYSYKADSSLDNLVLSCLACNLVKSDKVFESLAEARDYILTRRNNQARRRGVNTIPSKARKKGKCKRCGSGFVMKNYNQVWCSSECRNEHHNEFKAEAVRKYREVLSSKQALKTIAGAADDA